MFAQIDFTPIFLDYPPYAMITKRKKEESSNSFQQRMMSPLRNKCDVNVPILHDFSPSYQLYSRFGDTDIVYRQHVDIYVVSLAKILLIRNTDFQLIRSLSLGDEYRIRRQ